MKINVFLAVAALLLSAGCMELEPGQTAASGNGQISVPVRIRPESDSRSACVDDELAVGTARVAWYAGGTLCGVSDVLDGGRGSISLLPDMYSFYVVANLDSFVFPDSEAAIAEVVVRLPSGTEGFLIPMCGCQIDKEVEDGSVLIFNLQRLYSRLEFFLEQNFEYGHFQVSSFRILQAATRTCPFGMEYSALRTDGEGKVISDDVCDMDYASEEDLAAVNGGYTVVLYAPENAMGVRNEIDSPSMKQPSFLSGALQDFARKATYLEVSGRWTATGVSTDVTYRIYLGANAVNDFNLLRGRAYRIRLSLDSYPSFIGSSDSGTWRIETDNLNDSRRLEFGTDRLVVYLGGEVFSTRVSCNYPSVDFNISGVPGYDLAGSGISFSTDGVNWTSGAIRCRGDAILYVRCEGSEEVQAVLKAETYDRAVVSILNVLAEDILTPFLLYDYSWDYDEDQVGNTIVNDVTETLKVRVTATSGKVYEDCLFKFPGSVIVENFTDLYEVVTLGPKNRSAPKTNGSLLNALSGIPVVIRFGEKERTWEWDDIIKVNGYDRRSFSFNPQVSTFSLKPDQTIKTLGVVCSDESMKYMVVPVNFKDGGIEYSADGENWTDATLYLTGSTLLYARSLFYGSVAYDRASIRLMTVDRAVKMDMPIFVDRNRDISIMSSYYVFENKERLPNGRYVYIDNTENLSFIVEEGGVETRLVEFTIRDSDGPLGPFTYLSVTNPLRSRTIEPMIRKDPVIDINYQGKTYSLKYSLIKQY